jgi:hypothetical protein
MSNIEAKHQKQMQQFTEYLMPSGEIRPIRNCYLLQFAIELLENVPPLSPGAETLRDAVGVSPGGDRLAELVSMLSDDEDETEVE